MTDATDEDEFDLPPPTAPENISITLRGFADRDEATALGHEIASIIRIISSLINLERLDGVTIAFDYDEALAELDRGVEELRPLTRSNDDQLVGVGMTPSVLRDGILKSHIVLHAPFVTALAQSSDESDDYKLAVYLLAHECAHVQVTHERDEAQPGVLLRERHSDYEAAIFGQVISACWDEYAACRFSAPFGRGHLEFYEEGLRNVLGVARERGRAARSRFWSHRNLNEVVATMGPPLTEPLRLAAYVLGHVDGSREAEVSQETQQAIEAAGYGEAVDDLMSALRGVWDERPDWRAEAAERIADVARDILWSEGLSIKAGNDGGAFIQVWEPGLGLPPTAGR